jgi:hypothetical protein
MHCSAPEDSGVGDRLCYASLRCRCRTCLRKRGNDRNSLGLRENLISRTRDPPLQRVQAAPSLEEPERLTIADGWRAAVVAVSLIIIAVPYCWVIGSPARQPTND